MRTHWVKHLLALTCATISCVALAVHAQTDQPEEPLAPQSGDMIRELRTSLNFGVWSRSGLGMWQFYALGFFGNDVGIDRGSTVTQGGVGVRWVP